MFTRIVIVGIITTVLITLGSYVIYNYGTSKFEAGYNKAQSEHSEAIVKTTITDAQALESITNETKAMSDPAVDADLLKLGVMRDDSDY